ncbi:MAG: TolC family protein [Bacillota bacterium]
MDERKSKVMRFKFVITAVALLLLMPAKLHAESRPGKTQAREDAIIKLTYDRAKAFAKLNSVTLKKLVRSERDSYEKYDDYLKQAERIDPWGFTYSIGGKEYYFYYDLETRLMMRKAKELVPGQMKLAWEIARDSREIAENSMEISLRGIYMGTYSARADLLLKQKQLELVYIKNKHDRIRLDRGLISPLDMEESEYNLLKAKKEAAAAERNYESMVRNLNQFMGFPLGTRFSDIMIWEEPESAVLEPVEHYIGKALNNRLDIKQIEKQIALKEQEKNIIESFNLYKVDTAAREEYEFLIIELEKLYIDLKAAKLSVENDIRNAYADIIKAEKSVESVKKAMELQKSAYEKMKARYDAGQVAEIILRQAEINLAYAQNSYTAALFDYKTRLMRFEYAVGIGPAYQG